MAGLQRSAISLRKQGSSGLVWLNQAKPRYQQDGELQKSEGQRLARMQQQDGAREKLRASSQPQSMKHSRSDSDLYHHGGKDVKVSIAALPRSTISFRRQGSSGVVWDESFFAAELNQEKPKEQLQAALPRSIISFRRQGSSGVVWDDSSFSAELNQEKPKEQPQACLPRSTISFRRQGSSGAVWDDSSFSMELSQEKPKEQQDGETKIFEVPRPLQRKPSHSNRIIMRYRCCKIEDVFENSIVRIRLSAPRLIAGDRSHCPPTKGPIKVGTKPRKDWHQKN